MVLVEKTMNELYLSKKTYQYKEYLIEEQIYQDIYQYRETDNITLQMLSSIILNNNQHLFLQVIEKRTLTNEEQITLLKMICEEGDDYFYFFNILFENFVVSQDTIKILIEKAMISDSIKILEILFKETNTLDTLDLNGQFIHNCLERNPSCKLLEFLTLRFDKTLILTPNFLTEIFNNDYVNLFIFYVKNKKTNNWNFYLHTAIQKNAYDIIDYILNQIDKYETKKEKNYYNDFFDYLMTEKFDKIIMILSKTNDIFEYGYSNLEKLLLSFDGKEQFEILLFDYNLISMPIKNEFLNHKVGKYILNKKLHKNLKIKQQKDIKKI